MSASDAPAKVKLRCRRCGSPQPHAKRGLAATEGAAGPQDVLLVCRTCGNTQKAEPAEDDTVLEIIERDLDYGVDLETEIARRKAQAERSRSREDRAAWVQLRLYRVLLLVLGAVGVAVAIWLVFFGGAWILLKEMFNLR